MTRFALGALLALAFAGSADAAAGPPSQGIVPSATGAGLYAANCSSCHGPHGQGVPPPGRPGEGDVKGEGPSLRGVGALAADFYLRTGYMPLAAPNEQPSSSHVLFTDRQIRQIVAYVATFGKGPAIPTPHPQQGSLSAGFQLFAEHCAGCHQIVAQGGYVTKARVPPLIDATDREIAEAVRAGPYVMPTFSKSAISDAQLNSLIAYVDYTKHPDDAGGWALGHVGPIPEGMVSWLLAGVVLVGTCLVFGKRVTR